jgi:hypothetical protein
MLKTRHNKYNTNDFNALYLKTPLSELAEVFNMNTGYYNYRSLARGKRDIFKVDNLLNISLGYDVNFEDYIVEIKDKNKKLNCIKRYSHYSTALKSFEALIRKYEL